MQNVWILHAPSHGQTSAGATSQPLQLTSRMVTKSKGCVQESLTLSLPRKSQKRTVFCQVRGCCLNLTDLGKVYCIRKRICPEHLTAESVLLDQTVFGETEYRFCHQCGKLEPVTHFDGNKRSCRVRLLRRRVSQRTRGRGRKRGVGDFSLEYSDDEYEPRSLPVRRDNPESAGEDELPRTKRSRKEALHQHYEPQGQPAPASHLNVHPLVDVPFTLCNLQQNAAPDADVADALAPQQQLPQQQQQVQVEPASSTTNSKMQLSPSEVALAIAGALDPPAAAATAVSPYSFNPTANAARADPQHTPQGIAPAPAAPADVQPAAAAATATDQALDEMLQAITSGEPGVDVQLIQQLELELAAEQQQQQQGCIIEPIVSPVAAAVDPSLDPVSATRHDLHGRTAAAARHAAAQPVQGHNNLAMDEKMELVNKLLDGLYQDMGAAAEADIPDSVVADLEKQILAQIADYNKQATGAAAAAAAAALESTPQQHQLLPAPAYAVPVGPANAGQANHVIESPDTAATTDLLANCPPFMPQQQQVTATRRPTILASSSAAAAAPMLTMHAATAAAAPAAPAAAVAHNAATMQRWMLLQRKVQQMSLQLAHLQNAMARSAEEFIMMGPPGQHTMTNPVGAMPGQQYMHQSAALLTQQSLNSNASAVTAMQLKRLRQQQQQGLWGGPAAATAFWQQQQQQQLGF